MPPPNITGQLHMGHALDNTLQDVLIRYHAHAGLRRRSGCRAPTTPPSPPRSRSSSRCAKEGLTKEDIGREAFLERAWKWKEEYGGRIVDQLAPPRLLLRLAARALHHGRGLQQRRARGVRAPLRQGPDLPRQPHHQLVPRTATPRSPTPRWSTRSRHSHLWHIRYPRRRTAANASSWPPRGRRPCWAIPPWP